MSEKKIYRDVDCNQAKCFGNYGGFCQVLSRKKDPCRFYKTVEQCERQHKKVERRLAGLKEKSNV